MTSTLDCAMRPDATATNHGTPPFPAPAADDTMVLPIAWPPLSGRLLCLTTMPVHVRGRSTDGADDRTVSVDATDCGLGRIALHHAVDGTITVERPGGAMLLRNGRLGLPAQAGPFPWEGGLPFTAHGTAATPDARLATTDDQAVLHIAAPVLAAWISAQGGTASDCRAAWIAGEAIDTALWLALAPALHAEAAHLTIQSTHGATMYRALVQRADVRDHIRYAPGIGPLLTVTHIATLPDRVPSLETVAAHAAGAPITASGMLWLRLHPMDHDTLPYVPADPRIARRIAASVMRAGVAAASPINPQQLQTVQRLMRDDDHATTMQRWWLLATLCTATPTAATALRWCTADPLAAVRVVDTALPPDHRAPTWRGRCEQIIDLWGAWACAEPDAAANANGARGATDRALKWDRTMRDADAAYGASRDAYLQRLEADRAAQRAVQEAAARAAAQAAAAQAIVREAVDTRQRQLAVTAPFQRVPHTPELTLDTLRLRWLGTDEALRAEGQRMAHCVGGYGWRCRRNGFVIFAVETLTGEGLGTLSFTGENKLHMFLGHDDKPVPDALRTLAIPAARRLLLP